MKQIDERDLDRWMDAVAAMMVNEARAVFEREMRLLLRDGTPAGQLWRAWQPTVDRVHGLLRRPYPDQFITAG